MTRSRAAFRVPSLTFSALALILPAVAFAASPTVRDQSRFLDFAQGSITTLIQADDFAVTSPMHILSADVWLSDQDFGNDGTLFGYSGTLCWTIYSSTGSAPGTALLAGRAIRQVLTDTGYQTQLNNDIVRVHFDLEPAVGLAPGTYWFALHEGIWGTTDGTALDWESAVFNFGGAGVSAPNSATPAVWTPAQSLALVLYGGPLLWNEFEADALTLNNFNASASVLAADFVNSAPFRLGSADLWFADNGINDNGIFDSFSGTVGWAVYSDAAMLPAALLASGSEAQPQIVDTGSQDPFGGDIFHVRIQLTPPSSLVLSPGTYYWFAVHEGAWGSPNDGTPIWWQLSPSLVGEPTASAPPSPSPTGWSLLTNDNAFVLFTDLVFASGFEAGVTCAWSAPDATHCP